MTTPTDLRNRATQRRHALDCDSQVARDYDAAADALEAALTERDQLRAELARAQLDLAAYQEARAGLLEVVQRLKREKAAAEHLAAVQRAILEDVAKGHRLRAICYNGAFHSIEDVYAILEARREVDQTAKED